MANVDVQSPPRFGAGLLNLWRRIFRPGRCDWRDPERCAAFTTAFVSLAAKMAKADGVAVAAEAETFERFLDVSDETLCDVRRLYTQATADTAGFEIYADRIAKMLHNDTATKRRVFECLFFVACSDGVLHHAEDVFLHEVARRFGYDEHTFRCIRATFVHDPESPYTVLDVSPRAPDRVIKAHYRKLIAENHPDRLIAEGAPAAVVKSATAKVAAYNAAFEQIVTERRSRE